MQRPLATINDTVARSLYVKQLAERIGIEENIVLEKVRDQVGTKQKYDLRVRKDDENQKGSRLEQQIIAMMLQFPAILSEIKKNNVIDFIENKDLKAIAQTALAHHMSSVEQISELLSVIDNPEQKRLVSALAMIEEPWDEGGCLKLIRQFVKSRKKLRDNRILEQIKAAESKNDQEALDRLLKEKQKLAVRGQKQHLA